MKQFSEETYGDRIHEIYDRLYGEFDPQAIDVLTSLAGKGRALELGIGTGRLALPLQKRGVEVHGVDASRSMIEKLRAKPGGERIPVTEGDFGQLPVEGHFDLIYVVFNTFFALDNQEKQVDCFQHAARRLKPGGIFLIEAFVPDLARFDRGQRVSVTGMTEDEVRLDAARHDLARQTITSQHILLTSGDGVELYPVKLRYAWPSELDLMAKLAGMTLKERWSSWKKEPFQGKSEKHISLYTLREE